MSEAGPKATSKPKASTSESSSGLRALSANESDLAPKVATVHSPLAASQHTSWPRSPLPSLTSTNCPALSARMATEGLTGDRLGGLPAQGGGETDWQRR